MKQKHYIITFQNKKTVFVSAFNEGDAIILAQAIMIKHGMDKSVAIVKETTNISDMADTDFIA